jgi:hypothetical protein
VVVALNSESIYSEIDWVEFGSLSTQPFVLDTRGILDRRSLSSSGLLFDIVGSAS